MGNLRHCISDPVYGHDKMPVGEGMPAGTGSSWSLGISGQEAELNECCCSLSNNFLS